METPLEIVGTLVACACLITGVMSSLRTVRLYNAVQLEEPFIAELGWALACFTSAFVVHRLVGIF